MKERSVVWPSSRRRVGASTSHPRTLSRLAWRYPSSCFFHRIASSRGITLRTTTTPARRTSDAISCERCPPLRRISSMLTVGTAVRFDSHISVSPRSMANSKRAHALSSTPGAGFNSRLSAANLKEGAKTKCCQAQSAPWQESPTFRNALCFQRYFNHIHLPYESHA